MGASEEGDKTAGTGPGYELTRDDLLVALNRIEGQVRGVKGMIERGSYCVDVLVQLAAIRGALGRVTMSMLETHLQGCVRGALEGGSPVSDGHDHIEEILTIVKRFM